MCRHSKRWSRRRRTTITTLGCGVSPATCSWQKRRSMKLNLTSTSTNVLISLMRPVESKILFGGATSSWPPMIITTKMGQWCIYLIPISHITQRPQGLVTVTPIFIEIRTINCLIMIWKLIKPMTIETQDWVWHNRVHLTNLARRWCHKKRLTSNLGWSWMAVKLWWALEEGAKMEATKAPVKWVTFNTNRPSSHQEAWISRAIHPARKQVFIIKDTTNMPMTLRKPVMQSQTWIQIISETGIFTIPICLWKIETILCKKKVLQMKTWIGMDSLKSQCQVS